MEERKWEKIIKCVSKSWNLNFQWTLRPQKHIGDQSNHLSHSPRGAGRREKLAHVQIRHRWVFQLKENFPVVRKRRKSPFQFRISSEKKINQKTFRLQSVEMDFATGGIAAGGFYGAGMAGSRFDREFEQRTLSRIRRTNNKFLSFCSNLIYSAASDYLAGSLLGELRRKSEYLHFDPLGWTRKEKNQ